MESLKKLPIFTLFCLCVKKAFLPLLGTSGLKKNHHIALEQVYMYDYIA